MDRSVSPPTDRAAYQAPPWETRQLKQVPYQGSDAVRSRPTAHEAFGSGSSSYSQGADAVPQQAHSRSASQRSDYPAWQRRPSQVANSQSQENTGQIPTAPWTSPDLPSFVNRTPPSPPLSDDKGPSRAASVSSTPRPDVKALPGTMSSRANREQMRPKNRSLSKLKGIDSVHNKENSPGFGAKFKTAMKDLFHRSPIDESSFEKIQGRHWSEEDY